ncbi:MAG: RHH-type proline utilization regulon transcriptional repressor/proline dehydrogenase [Nitriliruptoraceae bacterium]|jgi:RHH-type proline utilization regulon transcriptional repressor/proline dehydrogenase/delta 1-pyrroline-5-carboxylate dehydrogenase
MTDTLSHTDMLSDNAALAADALVADDPMADYLPEAMRPWHSDAARMSFAAAVEARDRDRTVLDIPIVIDGVRRSGSGTLDSIDPGDTARVIARAENATAAHADEAIASALRAHNEWSRTPAAERGAVLRRAAQWMRERRDELAALQVFEAGKPWAEGDADLCEAIDFLEYYARQAVVLERGGEVQSPPGEANSMSYRPRGVTVVIAPWNFPLAIPTGMVAGAIAAGNATILKPAEQTPAVAYGLLQAFEAAGLPKGVLNFLPGPGEVVGARLVEHPDVATIVFTGSRAVGFGIMETAAKVVEGQRTIKRVICELGGKNPLLIASDADLDEVVPAAAKSAFGFAGQKCSATSRLLVVDELHDQLVARLVEHSRELLVGHPRDGEVDLGPVIDAEAHARLMASSMPDAGTVVHRGAAPEGGFFVPPTIVTGLPDDHPYVRDEHFGPLLAVVKRPTLDGLIEVANSTPYALTAGVFTRSARDIQHVTSQLRAGNIYVNRGTTGAIVGRQPFGGFGHSGVGSKAGGPDYLKNFTDPVVVTENTVRAGFTPDLLS